MYEAIDKDRVTGKPIYSADTRTWGNVIAFLLADAYGIRPEGDWETYEEFVGIMKAMNVNNLLHAYDVEPPLETVWAQILYKYRDYDPDYGSGWVSEDYEPEFDADHFEDTPPVQETGYGRGLNDIILDWYQDSDGGFEYILHKLGFDYSEELMGMSLSDFDHTMGSLIFTIGGFPDSALLLSAFEHNRDYWVSRIHMMLTQSYPIENIAQDWNNDISFPLWSFDEGTSEIQLYDFGKNSIVNSIIWAVIQEYTTPAMIYKDDT
jgi:hypothetical protein